MPSKKKSEPTAPPSRTSTRRYRPLKEVEKLVTWAQAAGVQRITVGDVEVTFIANPLMPKDEVKLVEFSDENPPTYSVSTHDVPPNLQHLLEKPEEVTKDAKEAFNAVISGQHDAEAYAEQSDIWARQTRLPRRSG